MKGVLPDPGKLLGFETSTSLSLRGHQVALVALLAASVLAVLLFIDLSPQVDRTLFFSTDDEELSEDRAIREMFRAPPQVIISARPAGDFTDEYVSRVGDLSRQIRGIDDVVSVRDILHGPEEVEDAFENPMWSRLLVSEDGESTNLIVVLGTEEFGEAVSRIEQAVEEHRSPDFRLTISGEPVVVEEIRRQVTRDMSVFGLATLPETRIPGKRPGRRVQREIGSEPPSAGRSRPPSGP